MNDDNESLLYAPRFDLREKAFRRYEDVISRAVKQSFIIPLKAFDVKQHTLYCRIKDAILGKKRYKYNSMVIPDTFDLDSLKVMELADGRVAIVNTPYEKSRLAKPTYPASDHERIAWLIRQMAANQIPPGVEVTYSTPEELAWLEQYERDNNSLFFIHPDRQPGRVRLYA